MTNMGSEVQTFRTDKGTEYGYNVGKEFLRAHIITYVTTGRAVHAQICVTEIMNRTLTEMARTMPSMQDFQNVGGYMRFRTQ